MKSLFISLLLAAACNLRRCLAETSSMAENIVVTESYNSPTKYVTSYTTDTYTITPCQQARAEPSSKPDCKLYAATGDVFVVLANTTTTTFTDADAYSSFSTSVLNQDPSSTKGYALNGTSITAFDKVEGSLVPSAYPLGYDIVDELNITITYSGPRTKYRNCPTIAISYLFEDGFLTLPPGKHLNDKIWKPFIDGSSCASAKVTKGVITRTPIVLVLKTPEPEPASSSNAEAASTVKPLPSPTSSEASVQLETTSSKTQQQIPAETELSEAPAPIEEPSRSAMPVTSESISDLPESILSLPTPDPALLSTTQEPLSTSIRSDSSQLQSSPSAASHSETLVVPTISVSSSTTSSSSSTSSLENSTSSMPRSTGLMESSTASSSQGATSTGVPLNATESADLISVPGEFSGDELGEVASFSTFAARFMMVSSDVKIEDLPPVGQSVWWELKSEIEFEWTGPQMYVYPVWSDGKWRWPWGEVTAAPPSNWIKFAENIPWPPPPLGAVDSWWGSQNSVETTTGARTVDTTVNGRATKVVSSFTSLITKPPVRPSISVSLETSTFMTSEPGRGQFQVTTVISRGFAIGPSSTITSVGTSWVPTVIDGTSTSVASLFTTTKVVPGETYALYGGLSTVSTVIDGTTTSLIFSLLAGTLLTKPGQTPATNIAEGFTTYLEGIGATYIVDGDQTLYIRPTGTYTAGPQNSGTFAIAGPTTLATARVTQSDGLPAPTSITGDDTNDNSGISTDDSREGEKSTGFRPVTTNVKFLSMFISGFASAILFAI